MKNLILAALAFGAMTGSALAESMVCKNDRREYVVEFDGKHLVAKAEEGATPYTVTGVKQRGKRTTVTGKTPSGGPDYRATFGSKMKMEFLDGGKVVQTDKCSAKAAEVTKPAPRSRLTTGSTAAFCANEWPSDYRMQVYCAEKQRQGFNTTAVYMNGKPALREIVSKCESEWSTAFGPDWRMVAYCSGKQWDAYRLLHGEGQ
jgi:hypothetical protein